MSNPKPTDDSSESSSSSDSEFESSSQAEDFEDYKLDGYHPVSLGDIFHNGKYIVIQKLGWGHFSTVWLVNERKTNNYFALKIQKSKKSYFEAAMDELEICEHLNKYSENSEWKLDLEAFTEKFKPRIIIGPNENFVIKLCDKFVHFGMHGKHPCSAFEVMGPNLLDLIQHFENNQKFCSIWLVKHISIQILLGLDYIHRICKIIHTDLKPENVMFSLDNLELDDFVKDLQNYKKKPASMKFLKFLKNKMGKITNKNKKKYQKKKNKKKKKNTNDEFTQPEQEKITEKLHTLNEPNSSEIKNELLNNMKNLEEKPDLNDQISIKECKIQEISEESKGELKNMDQIQSTNATNEQEEPIPHIESPIPSKEKTENYNPDILRWKDHILIHLDEKIRIKLVDFGNACWENKHFTENIQTREYRSPEAILGIPYTTNTDIWSFACMVFEMLTNTFLFKPRKGEDYGKNEDHLALMIETLGRIPKSFSMSGKNSKKYFNKNGQLIRIKNIKEYRIKDILIHDFNFGVKDAEEIEEFLLPMLEYDPKKRIDAKTALESKWLWS